MNLRQKKKRIKKKWGLNRIPKGTDIFLIDSCAVYIQKELSRRVWERMEHALIYGEQNDG